MTNEERQNLGAVTPFTLPALQKLKNRGFRFMQVNGFSSDKRLDYMEPRYFILVPLKDLPTENDRKGIYEPIDSQLMLDWANIPPASSDIFIKEAMLKRVN
jgi:hypothetical protein